MNVIHVTVRAISTARRGFLQAGGAHKTFHFVCSMSRTACLVLACKSGKLEIRDSYVSEIWFPVGSAASEFKIKPGIYGLGLGVWDQA